MKECTAEGVKIKECLTDAGIAVGLNSNLALSGIVYSWARSYYSTHPFRCTLHTNGTVSINREAIPNKNHFQTDNVSILFMSNNSNCHLTVRSNIMVVRLVNGLIYSNGCDLSSCLGPCISSLKLWEK